MSVYAAREIYRFARLAGFDPDQAVTMTAIALAESGGDSGALNPDGEDSRGLWQINVAAHRGLARHNLYDPVENAKAAYQVSEGGADVSPWTTTHGGTGAPYVAYRAQALAAARASGDPAVGVFTGTEGYHHPLAAGGGAGGHPDGSAAFGPELAAGGADPAGNGPLRTFLEAASAQDGDPYVWGAEAASGDADPTAFDCSELVQWAAARAGVQLPDGSWLQYLALQQQGATVTVEQALHTPGALLFSFSEQPTAGGGRPAEAHVAISLGDGRTIEAQSPQSGVGSFPAGDRFSYAAVIPGISAGDGGPAGPTGTLALAGAGAGVDTDRDGLTDALEARLGLSRTAVDSDHDNLSDGYELLTAHTDPTRADSDGDRLLDSLELALGSDPMDPDSDQDGRVDGARDLPGGTVDTDHDGVSDVLERILRTDPTKADSDGDGFVDGAEYRSGFDPAAGTSNPLSRAAAAATGTAATGTTGTATGTAGAATDPAADAVDPVTAADPAGAGTLGHPLTAAVDPDPTDQSWGLDGLDHST